MKLQRLFMMGLMVTSIALIASCSDGEDGADGATGPAGATGPTGAAGADGAQGADGIACWDLNGNGVGEIEVGSEDNEDINADGVVDVLDCQGADGADGNANVHRLIIDTNLYEEGFNPAQIGNIDELSEEVLNTNAILTYLVSSDIGLYAPIPATIDLNGLRSFNVGFAPQTVVITETTGAGWSNTVSEVHLLLIEQTGSTNIGGGGGGGGGGQQSKAHADVLASLKAAQVNVNNYKEVLQYFGLDQ